MARRILSTLGQIAVTGRDIQHPIAAEYDARSEAAVGGAGASVPGLGDQNIFDVGERLAVPLPARNGQRRALHSAFFHGLRIREVNQLVLGELRVEDDVHQACQTAGVNVRQAGDRLLVEDAVANDSQSALAFRDQHAAVRQKCEAPRM